MGIYPQAGLKGGAQNMRTMSTLMNLADEHGITIDYWDFPDKLWALYMYHPHYGPIIGLADSLRESPALLKVAMGHELGHHFTGGASGIPLAGYTYVNRWKIAKAECKATRWAARYLMPLEEVMQFIQGGCALYRDLAGSFDLPPWFVQYRMEMQDAKVALANWRKEVERIGLVAESGNIYNYSG
jgi:Zn-dependent peptidase ImmA (M78 family)